MIHYLAFINFLPLSIFQSIPEECTDNHTGDAEGSPSTIKESGSENEIAFHLSDEEEDEEDEDLLALEEERGEERGEEEKEEEEKEEEEKEEEEEEEEEKKEEEVEREGEEQNGESSVAKEIETPVEREDPEAVALKKRT